MDDESDSQPSTSQKFKKKKENVTPFQLSLLQALNNPHTPVEEVDADKQFLLSFLPGIKRLTEEQKMEFKFQFHQLFRSFIRNITVHQATQNDNNNYGFTNMPNIPHQVQQENYQSPRPQPSPSLSYINQQPYYPSTSHLSSFSSFPRQQPYQSSTFISTPVNQSSSYSSVPISQQDYFNENDETVDSV